MDEVSMPDSVVVQVPFRVVKRGGRKQIEPPTEQAAPRSADSTLLKALARAFRWKRMVDSRQFATIADLAEREAIAVSYLTRILRLTLLAPDVVEAILNGQLAPNVTLGRLLEPIPEEWVGHAEHVSRAHAAAG
jgi:hypothetical protein